MTMLSLTQIDKTFNRGTVNKSVLFSGFDFSVERGEFVAVIGSNGSGKTTMLNIISGSTAPDAGTVTLDGEDITAMPEYRRFSRIGRVFQDPSVGTLPDMTIFENLSVAAAKGSRYGLAPLLRKEKRESFRALLSPLGLGLEEKLDIPVGLLSGGQRQALSLLMSTMTPIDLLLLDEHTAALDPKTAETVMALTASIVEEKRLTTVMVTHNLRYAVIYGTRLVMMHKGKCILDLCGEDKKNASVEDLLKIFDEISIELGN